jgi:hypothetical protein
MRFKQSVTAAFAVAAGVAISVGAPATSAHAATTVVTLPITSYSHMLVDSAHKHLFITSGSGSTSILVTDYSGQTVATIGNEPGATGLALSPDGSTVYAALAAGDAVSAISTSTLAETARYATGTGTDPTYVAATSGKIWFSYDAAAAQASIGSIDPSTSPATVTLSAAAGTWSIPPVLAATASGELVASEPSQSPNELATYDVSTGTATVLAPQQFFTEAGNFKSMAITPDGQDVVTASGAPYQQEIFKISDLSAAGTYPTTPYPNSVAIAADGTVAAGTTIGSNEVFMFAPGGSTPLNTISFGSNQLADDGVALTPDDSLLFAITLQNAPTLNIIPNPAQHGHDLLAQPGRDRPGHDLHRHRDRYRGQPDHPDRDGHLRRQRQRWQLLRQHLHARPGRHQRAGVVLGQLYPQLHPAGTRLGDALRRLHRGQQPRLQRRHDRPHHPDAAGHRHHPDLPARPAATRQVHGRRERHLIRDGHHAYRHRHLHQQPPRHLQQDHLHPVRHRHVGIVLRLLHPAVRQPDPHRHLRR